MITRPFTLESAAAFLGGSFARVEVERTGAHLCVTEVEPLIAYIESMDTIDQVPPKVHDSIAARLAAERAFRISKESGIVTAVGWLPGG